MYKKDFNPRTPRGVRLLDSRDAALNAIISIHAPREGCDVVLYMPSAAAEAISIHAPREGCDTRWLNFIFLTLAISIHAPREGCDSKLYQRAGSLLGSICLFAQGEEG